MARIAPEHGQQHSLQHHALFCQHGQWTALERSQSGKQFPTSLELHAPSHHHEEVGPETEPCIDSVHYPPKLSGIPLGLP